MQAAGEAGGAPAAPDLAPGLPSLAPGLPSRMSGAGGSSGVLQPRFRSLRSMKSAQPMGAGDPYAGNSVGGGGGGRDGSPAPASRPLTAPRLAPSGGSGCARPVHCVCIIYARRLLGTQI